MDDDVIAWIRERSHPFAAHDPHDSLDELAALDAVVDGAAVVGLGEASRFAHEVFTARFRMLRYLVERRGFRALALEEDWTKGQELDAYVRTGRGDPRRIIDGNAWAVWRTEEFVDALRWVRERNRAHPDDPVRIVGLDFERVQASAYEEVLDHLRRHAPGRSAEAEAHYALLRPEGEPAGNAARVAAHADPGGLVDRAERVRDLVGGTGPEDERESAEWNARVIAGFHRWHAPGVAPDSALMADGIARWHRRTGARIVYWGGTGHSAVRPGTEGGRLREYFGRAYRSIGCTFDRGELLWPLAPAAPELAEATLRDARPGPFLLDVRDEAPVGVRAWLDGPTRVRVIGPHYDAARDAEFSIEGESLRTLFDAVVFLPEVTPVRSLEG